jgi:hypothetical protein
MISLLSQGVVSVVERSAIGSSGHSSAINIGASILESRSSIGFISNTVIRSRIQPKNLSIRQDVAASESIDVVDGVVDDIAIAGHHDDASEVLEYVRVEDCHQVHGGTVEGVGASAHEIAVVQLAGLVLGKEKGLHGSVLDLHAMSESTGLVEESVYGVDVDVPLVDGCFGISLGGIAGDGIDHADISGLTTVFGGIPGYRRVGRSSFVVFLIYSSKYCKQEGSYDSFALAKPAFDQIVLPTTLA